VTDNETLYSLGYKISEANQIFLIGTFQRNYTVTRIRGMNGMKQ
jgi:hypothetical protein